MEKKLKVGVIGLRMGGAWAKAAKDLPEAELRLVYDKDVEHMARQAKAFDAPAAGSEKEFFAADLDIAVIATPDHLHVEQSLKAMDNGMNAICEKPLAPTVADCRKIIAKVEATGKAFMTGQVCRYTPAFQTAKQLVTDGEIGELAFIESEYAHDYSKSPGIDNWRRDPAIKRQGFIGGGCHALDLIRWIAGDPEEVFCYTNRKFLPDWPADDTGVAIYKFASGLIGKVFVSIGIKSKYTMRTVIYGTQGTIICDNTSPTLKLYKATYRDVSKSQEFWEIPVKVDNHNVTSELKEFIERLNRGEKVPTDVYEGARTVAFGEAALTSARTGQPVKLKELFA